MSLSPDGTIFVLFPMRMLRFMFLKKETLFVTIYLVLISEKQMAKDQLQIPCRNRKYRVSWLS